MPRGNEGSDSNVVLWPSFDIGGKGYLTAAEYTKYIDAGGYNISAIPTTSDAAGGTKVLLVRQKRKRKPPSKKKQLHQKQIL